MIPKRVALSWSNPEDHQHSISIQGRVVESYEGDQAEADIDSLAKKYLGKDSYPNRRAGEVRVLVRILPEKVQTLG